MLMNNVEHGSPGDAGPDVGNESGSECGTHWLSQDGRWLPQNKRMKLTIALASPHGTRRRGSACSPFGEHRALAAYPRCSADRTGVRTGVAPGPWPLLGLAGTGKRRGRQRRAHMQRARGPRVVAPPHA